MNFFIKYYYKDCLVAVMAISDDQKAKGWANNRPPFQPENWDRWEIEGRCGECG